MAVIQEESPETARRLVARLKERRALRSSADLPTTRRSRRWLCGVSRWTS